MHVKHYCSRNWRYDPPWLQETTSSSTSVPQENFKQSRWYLSHCVPEWGSIVQHIAKDHPQDTDERMLQLLLQLLSDWFFSLNSKPLSYTFLLLMKRVSLKWKLRRSVRVQNPPSSQIASHLSKAPIKIQSLVLLIGSGSDRQHELRHFRFHDDLKMFLKVSLLKVTFNNYLAEDI